MVHQKWKHTRWVNNTFIKLLTDILNSKKKSKKIIGFLNNLESKGIINNQILLFIIRVITIILSYFPEKYKTIENCLVLLTNININSKFVKMLKKSNISKIEDYADDNLMDQLIFKTFEFIENVFNLSDAIFINIYYEILLNTEKIKSEDNILKLNMYLIYLKNCNKIIIKETKTKNTQVYLKIVDVCGTTTRLINDFIG